MSSKQLNRIAQLCLLTIWMFLIVTTLPAAASSEICEQPKYAHKPLIANSWLTGTEVIVEIDGFFDDDEIAGLESGNAAWNNTALIACSGVQFILFDAILMLDYEETPPLHHLRWQRDDPGGGANGRVFAVIGFAGVVEAARIKISPNAPNIAQGTFYNYLGTHEVGHTFNLLDCVSGTGCTGTEETIMRGHSDGITSSNTFNTSGPKECDLFKVMSIYCSPPLPSPSPSPQPSPPDEAEPCQNLGWYWNFTNNTCNQEPQTCANHCVPYNPLDSGGCLSAVDYCAVPYGCPSGTVDGGQGCCCFGTPIVIDIAGNGFDLTDGISGVEFDMGGDGHREPVSWTRLASDDAWLVLDRNGNGTIDSSKEMFGNFADQPHATTSRNGFVALAEYDRTENGGIADGEISRADSVFTHLRLWQDKNHNGVSEADELSFLAGAGVVALDLNYKESKRTDAYGNRFGYRARVRLNHKSPVERWAWDVTLTTR